MLQSYEAAECTRILRTDKGALEVQLVLQDLLHRGRLFGYLERIEGFDFKARREWGRLEGE